MDVVEAHVGYQRAVELRRDDVRFKVPGQREDELFAAADKAEIIVKDGYPRPDTPMNRTLPADLYFS
jgi:hypothetical protein